MFCPKCGVAVQDDATFCAKCGATVAALNSNASVTTAKPASISPPTPGTGKRWGLPGVIAVVVGLVVLWIVFSRRSPVAGVSGLDDKSNTTDGAVGLANRQSAYTYRAIDDAVVLKLSSSVEAELTTEGDHIVCQYVREGTRLRITMDALGTKRAFYYDITPEGLRDESGAVLYKSERYEIVMREVGIQRKQAAANGALFEACKAGKLEAAASAIKEGAQVTATVTDEQHYTPLHLAANAGNPELIKLLLDKGANPNARTADKRTPLHCAANPWGKARIISMLLDAKADVNALTEQGETSLMIARRGLLYTADHSENEAVIKALVAAQAQLEADEWRDKAWATKNPAERDEDYREALKLYQKAADAGHTKAMVCIGAYYMNGWGVATDLQEAAKWLQKAADAGDGFAMNQLGCCYEHGVGVAHDEQQAIKWFRKSAELGNEEAKAWLTEHKLVP